jgi:hypothetical protein
LRYRQLNETVFGNKIEVMFKNTYEDGFLFRSFLNYSKWKILKKVYKINRKFRVPRKQGAHFLGARAQIQDSWVFHLQYEISVRQSTI